MNRGQHNPFAFGFKFSEKYRLVKTMWQREGEKSGTLE